MPWSFAAPKLPAQPSVGMHMDSLFSSFYHLSPSSHENETGSVRATHKLVSLSAYGTVDQPLLASVWRKQARPTPQFFEFGPGGMGLDLNGAASKLLSALASGRRLSHVGAVGELGGRYFLVFEDASKLNNNFVMQFGLSSSIIGMEFEVHLRTRINSEMVEGWRKRKLVMSWACIYGTPGDPHAAVVLKKNPNPPSGPIAWNCDFLDDIPRLNERVTGYASGGLRPALIAPLVSRWKPKGKTHAKEPKEKLRTYFLSLWYDNLLGPWGPGYSIGNFDCCFDQMDKKTFEKHDKAARKSGLFPIRIMASGAGEDVRYAAIWAQDDQPVPRKWDVLPLIPPRTSVLRNPPPQPASPFAEFDGWMQRFMAKRGIRAGQLAIVRGGKLVCANAYRWAEKNFRLNARLTFRIGSVSKLITAVAFWRIIEELRKENPGIVFEDLFPFPPSSDVLTPKQNVALAARLSDLLKPDSQNPTLAQFKQINPVHLLRHISGLPRNVSDAKDVKKYTKKKYPLDSNAYLSYQVNQVSPTLPNTTGVYEYSNVGYLFLQEIVRRRGGDITKVHDYVQVVRALVFEKLHINERPHAGKLAIENRDVKHDVLFQAKDSFVDVSAAHEDGRLVYAAYGLGAHLEACTGTGGWVVAAVDLARILAALRPGGALFDDDAILAKFLERKSPPAGDLVQSGNVPTPGGLGWDLLPSVTAGMPADLVYSKGGNVKGGSCVAALWNPQGPAEEVVGIVVCFNSDYADWGDSAVAAFQTYIANMSASRAWPQNVDLFNAVLD